MNVLLGFLLFTCLSAMTLEPNHLNDQKIVDYLNSKQSLFKAALPRMPYSEFKSHLLDPMYLRHEENYAEEVKINENDVPESFDAREQWPACESIRIIRDQANCYHGSWAVSTASVMSDRLCIQSGGKMKALVSDTDILACCGLRCGLGCQGGYMDMAWDYVIKNGACTGGLYRQKGVCKPYAFHPCGEHKNQTYYGECPSEAHSPTCRHQCQLRYGKSYEEDKVYALRRYSIRKNELEMRKEIIKNGPIQGSFMVFSDFRYYKSGIYKMTWGKQEGIHGIKIIGWGVEHGIKYWLVSNSWNSDWGEDGLFRIRRGVDECAIEQFAYGGEMKV